MLLHWDLARVRVAVPEEAPWPAPYTSPPA
jgi:hypothetical protein